MSALFSPETLQAGAVKGLKCALSQFSDTCNEYRNSVLLDPAKVRSFDRPRLEASPSGTVQETD